jgi:hypothetical protein
MLSSLFGFGKRRRRSTKRSTKKHHSRKPPARLLKICKKYRVKATKKVGKHRVYKSIAVLKRACLKKARALRKKLLRKAKKHAKRSKRSKKSVHRRRHHHRRRSGFGNKAKGAAKVKAKTCHNPKVTDKAGCDKYKGKWKFGARRSRVPMFGNPGANYKFDPLMVFGKRRAGPRRAKVSKAKAMKAFRSFYKRHCAGARRSRYGFGDGGNPMLSASMGTEFCPNGMGGVLGTESTGLFPSPCRSATSSGPAAFGRYRRRRRSAAIGSHKRRYRRRRSTAIGTRRRRRASAVGAHHRRRRRRSAM